MYSRCYRLSFVYSMKELNPAKIRTLILLGLSLLALLLLTGGLSELHFKPGEQFNLYDWWLSRMAQESGVTDTGPVTPWDNWGKGVQVSVVIAFWTILAFSILYAVISKEFRRELVRAFLIVFPLIMLMPYIAEKFAPQEPRAQEAQGAAGALTFGGEPLPAPPAFIQEPPAWFLFLIKMLLLALVLAGIALLWRIFRPRPDPQAVVVRRVRQALSGLESGQTFKDVVIACYAQMCRELQEAQGIERPLALTPREFEVYLAAAGIDSLHIRQLTLLFEGVRYSDRPSDPVKERQAVQALQAITEAYGT
jgi:hypothetical protein